MSSRRTILLSSAKMASATMLSRILGLVREQVMAAIFGASFVTDAFLIAYRIPNMLRDLMAEGAFSSAFVPIFTEEKQKGEGRSRLLLWQVFLLLGSLSLLISLLMIFFAPELIKIFAPEFNQDPKKFDLTVDLLKIMAPYLFTVSLAALFMGALNTLKVFFIPSLSSAFFNVVMIACTLLLPAPLSARGYHPALALGIGVMLGGIVQVLIQLPSLIKKNHGPLLDRSVLDVWSPQTKRLLNRFGIGTIGIAATQINLLVSSILATSAAVGAVSWLTYAFRLFQFPVGILGVSIAGSNLVHFSEAWKAHDKEKAIDHLRTSYTLTMLMLGPAVALMVALSHASVQIVFERGAFDANDTLMTALALKYYALGLPFYGLYKLFAPVFYTLDRPKIPVIISSASIAFNIVFCLIFTPRFGFAVLALGTTLSMLLNSMWQGHFLYKILRPKKGIFFNLRLLKITIAALGCYFASHYTALKFPLNGEAFMTKILFFILSCASGLVVFGALLLLMGEAKELKALKNRRK